MLNNPKYFLFFLFLKIFAITKYMGGILYFFENLLRSLDLKENGISNYSCENFKLVTTITYTKQQYSEHYVN
jgi:hypothetical protein